MTFTVRPTQIERAAEIIKNHGYAVLWIKQPSHEDDGLVLFCDPHTIKRGYNGKRPLGCLHMSEEEEQRAFENPAGLERGVREAEAILAAGLR